MEARKHTPFVPEKTELREFTFKAVFFGAIFAVILGAANAYLGLKAGMTVAATFPAAVMAMAILKPLKGSVLEENMFRTTAAVGEALVAGAIFTIPAFLISGLWKSLNYVISTTLMLVGGVLGVLFVIFLRRILIEDTTLPFPESVATAEIVKAGQKGQTGAGYVFGALGLAAVIEFFKNVNGLRLFKDYTTGFIPFSKSKIAIGKFLTGEYTGGFYIASPAASPALMGVGYIIGPKLAAIVFSGGVFGWLFLVPLLVLLNSGFQLPADINWLEFSTKVWYFQVRPIAVGAMIVGAFYTLYKMRKSLWTGIKRAFKEIGKVSTEQEVSRLEKDLPYGIIVAAILFLLIPITIIYYYFTHNIGGALLSALVMTFAGFLFAAVAGYLVGTIGSSNNPISGLTLSTLILAAILMVLVGIKGDPGVAAVLGVAAVVCASSGVAGDIMQDLKVGHILGGTPWKMEIGVIIGVIAASLVMTFPLQVLHSGVPGGIGGPELPAPQAGLMAMLAKGIVAGEMAWGLVLVGMLFSVGLILIGSPSPMLIAVGMYLPFHTTFAIFVGGIIKFIVERIVEKRELAKAARDRIENVGTLLASGLIAGEALMGIILAALVVAKVSLPKISETPWGGLIVFAIIFYLLISLPLKAGKKVEEQS